MKKIVLLIACLCSLTMSAQLTVINNNHVEIGKPQLDIDTKFPAPAKVDPIIPGDLEDGVIVNPGGKLNVTSDNLIEINGEIDSTKANQYGYCTCINLY